MSKVEEDARQGLRIGAVALGKGSACHWIEGDQGGQIARVLYRDPLHLLALAQLLAADGRIKPVLSIMCFQQGLEVRGYLLALRRS